MKKSITLNREEIRKLITTCLRKYSIAIPSPENIDAFGKYFSSYGDRKIVLLGEATHGTAEFYRARNAISQELVKNHGFRIITVEADWPDASVIDRYVRHLSNTYDTSGFFNRFPTWMWKNAEFQEFIEWLREFNKDKPIECQVSFHGLDVYSLNSSIQAVIHYLDAVDPEEARMARRRYGCLTPWHETPHAYGRDILRGSSKSCQDEVVDQLLKLLSNRLKYSSTDGDAFFNAAQNARVVYAAEEYYRNMYYGSREAWNLRDRHMFETLEALLSYRGSSQKAIVWAHNSHIGNAAATSMGWAGEFNVGELCRMKYGSSSAHIGFGTDRGRVMAADEWGAPAQIKTILPAREDSYEYAFRKAGLSHSLTSWHEVDCRNLRQALMEPMLERAIGVIYRPDTEYLSHYFEAVLADQFDAYVWFEETSALKALHDETISQNLDTYPTGL